MLRLVVVKVLASYLCGSDTATASGTLGSPFSPHQKNNVLGTLCQTWRQFCLIIGRMEALVWRLKEPPASTWSPILGAGFGSTGTRSGTNSNLEKNWSLRKASLSSTAAERHRFQGFSRQEKWELNISLDASTKQSYSWISAAASPEFSRWSNTVRDVAFKRRPRWTKTNLPLEKAAPNSSIEKTTFLQCMVLPKTLLEINLFESSVDENKLSGRISTSPRNIPLSSLIRQTHRYGVRKKDSLKASFMKTPAGCFIYWIILLIYMGFTTNATTSMLSFTNQFCCHCSVDFVVSMPIGETITVLTTAHGSPCGSRPWITRIPVGFSSPKLPSSMGQLQLHGSGCSLTLPKLQNGWRIYKCAFYQGLCKTRVLQSPRRNAHSVRFMWKSHFW